MTDSPATLQKTRERAYKSPSVGFFVRPSNNKFTYLWPSSHRIRCRYRSHVSIRLYTNLINSNPQGTPGPVKSLVSFITLSTAIRFSDYVLSGRIPMRCLALIYVTSSQHASQCTDPKLMSVPLERGFFWFWVIIKAKSSSFFAKNWLPVYHHLNARFYLFILSFLLRSVVISVLYLQSSLWLSHLHHMKPIIIYF